jgi:hypothetical protein
MNRDEFGKRLPSRHASWSLTSNLFHRLSITSNLLQRSTHAPIYLNQSSCATKSNSTSPSLRRCAGLRRNPLPTRQLLASSPSLPHTNQLPSPPKDLIPSLLTIWQTSQNLLSLKQSSSLPCGLTRKKLASLWLNIHSLNSYRVVTPPRTSLPSCKAKYMPLMNSDVIKSSTPSRLLYRS